MLDEKDSLRVRIYFLPDEAIDDANAIYENSLKEGYATLRANGMDDFDEATDKLVQRAAENERTIFTDNMRKQISDVLTQVRAAELGNANITPESNEASLKIILVAAMVSDKILRNADYEYGPENNSGEENESIVYKAIKKVNELHVDWHELYCSIPSANSIIYNNSLFNDITAIPYPRMTDTPRSQRKQQVVAPGKSTKRKPVAPGQRRPATYTKPVKGEI